MRCCLGRLLSTARLRADILQRLVRRGSGGRERTGCDKLLPGRIHREIQSFKGASPQEKKIAGLSENNFIDCEVLSNAQNGEADTTSHNLSIGQYEPQVFFLPLDSNLLQFSLWDPSVLTSRVDKNLLEPDEL